MRTDRFILKFTILLFLNACVGPKERIIKKEWMPLNAPETPTPFYEIPGPWGTDLKNDSDLTKEIRVKNKELEKLGFELWNFQNQNEVCHACPAHLRLRSIENKIIWINITDKLGQYGEAPALLETFVYNSNIYLIFLNTFMGQEITEGSHFVYKFNPNSYSLKLIGIIPNSEFRHEERRGTYWMTNYKITNGKIIFTRIEYTTLPSTQIQTKDQVKKLKNEHIIINME